MEIDDKLKELLLSFFEQGRRCEQRKGHTETFEEWLEEEKKKIERFNN